MHRARILAATVPVSITDSQSTAAATLATCLHDIGDGRDACAAPAFT
jgi:hypothetical protein